MYRLIVVVVAIVVVIVVACSSGHGLVVAVALFDVGIGSPRVLLSVWGHRGVCFKSSCLWVCETTILRKSVEID